MAEQDQSPPEQALLRERAEHEKTRRALYSTQIELLDIHLAERREINQALEARLKDADIRVPRRERALARLKQDIAFMERRIDEVRQSVYWRISAPLRGLLDRLRGRSRGGW